MLSAAALIAWVCWPCQAGFEGGEDNRHTRPRAWWPRCMGGAWQRCWQTWSCMPWSEASAQRPWGTRRPSNGRNKTPTERAAGGPAQQLYGVGRPPTCKAAQLDGSCSHFAVFPPGARRCVLFTDSMEAASGELLIRAPGSTGPEGAKSWGGLLCSHLVYWQQVICCELCNSGISGNSM
jgi:hypothetical protein